MLRTDIARQNNKKDKQTGHLTRDETQWKKKVMADTVIELVCYV